MPNIGYGSTKKTRFMLPDGFRKLLVHNVKVTFSDFSIIFYPFKCISSNCNDLFMYLGVGNANDVK